MSDRIRSRLPSKEYDEGWERTFRSKKPTHGADHARRSPRRNDERPERRPVFPVVLPGSDD